MVPARGSVATVAWCSSKCSTRFGAPGCRKLTSVASVADSAYFMKHAYTTQHQWSRERNGREALQMLHLLHFGIEPIWTPSRAATLAATLGYTLLRL
jgi:hypothetical protein